MPRIPHYYCGYYDFEYHDCDDDYDYEGGRRVSHAYLRVIVMIMIVSVIFMMIVMIIDDY